MLYGIYNHEDPALQEGQIVQSNKVWHTSDADRKFEDGLRERGQKFVKVETPYVLSPDNWYADVTVEELIERPTMPIDQSKLHMRAGTDDHVLLTGIPTSSKFRIMAGAVEYMSGEMDSDGTELDLSVPVPCTCKIILEKWPYRTFEAIVEVHA